MSARHASRSLTDALSLSRSSTYVCRQCRRNAHPSQVAAQQRQFASERNDDLPLAERVRRKLWKGKPPGPENVDDLYGGPGALETMYRERKERRARARASQTPTKTFTPAPAPAESQDPMEAAQEDTSAHEPERVLARAKAARATESESTATEDEHILAGEKTLATRETAQAGSTYKEATTWDGLFAIGHKGHWKEMPVNAKDEYFGWLESPLQTEWSYSDLVSLLHQAIVESHTYKQSNWHSTILTEINAESPIPLHELEKATFDISATGSIEAVREVSNITNSSFKDALFRKTPEVDEQKQYTYEESEIIKARTEPTMTPLQPRLLYTPADQTFLDAKLRVSDPLTMTILKRFAYLANLKIPDPLLTDLASTDPTKNTIRTFLTNMAERTKRKPANVAEQLLNNEELAVQNNLLVLGRRETPVDKEKELGRWKVIERELQERGLPVLGRLVVQRP